MIIVLASRYDQDAKRLVERWASSDAHLLTCDDLSKAGWMCPFSDMDAGTFVLGGNRVRVGEIRGVLARLPWVTEVELVSIAAIDRSYVAAEMSAFLAFWLSELKRPVFNRPTAGSLNGPSWRPEHWRAAAKRVGFRVAAGPKRFCLGSPPLPEPQAAAEIIVVGDSCFGTAAKRLKEPSRRLAEAAKVGLLSVQFSDEGEDAAFVRASPFPEIEREDVEQAILRRLS